MACEHIQDVCSYGMFELLGKNLTIEEGRVSPRECLPFRGSGFALSSTAPGSTQPSLCWEMLPFLIQLFLLFY